MAAGADEKWTIDKLDGTNWTTWKFQKKHLLLTKELWGIVDGTEILAEDSGADARASFGRRSQKAFSVIMLAINTSHLVSHLTRYRSLKWSFGILITTMLRMLAV